MRVLPQKVAKPQDNEEDRMVEPKNNPLIDVLTSLLPDSWLTASACESGVLIRQRKLLIPAFFWTLIFGFAAGSQRTITALRRLYERRSGESIAHSSFFGRFDPFLLNWMKIVFQQTLIALQARCPAPKAKFLNGYWEILALDSSTFALADILQGKFASKSDKRAALKLHSIITSWMGARKHSSCRQAEPVMWAVGHTSNHGFVARCCCLTWVIFATICSAALNNVEDIF